MNKIRFAIAALLFHFIFIVNSQAQTGWKWGLGCNAHGIGTEIDAWTAATDNAGNVFSGGIIWGADSVEFGAFSVYHANDTGTLFITKVDSSGHYQWVLSSSVGGAFPAAMVADTSGNLYVLAVYSTNYFKIGTFSFFQLTPNNKYVLFKVSPTGTVLWAEDLGMQSLNSSDITYTSYMGIDGAGYIYITAVFDRPSITIGSTTLLNTGIGFGTNNIFTAKFDGSGTPVWAKVINDKKNLALNSMAVSANGTVYVAGAFLDTLTSGGLSLTDSLTGLSESLSFIVKLDSSGSSVWAVKDGQYKMSYTAIASDKADNIYLSGNFQGVVTLGTSVFTPLPGGSYNIFVARLNPSASVAWAKAAYNDSVLHVNTPFNINADNCGRVCVSGKFNYYSSYETMPARFLLFGTDTLRPPAACADPVFVAVYDTSGNYLMSSALAGGGEDWSGASVDNLGNLYLCSDNASDIEVGPDTLRVLSLGVETYYVAKYRYGAPCSSGTLDEHIVTPQADLILYPNPAYGSCTIKSSSDFGKGAVAGLYDVQGRLINTYPLQGNTVTISLNGIAPGLYFCRISSGNGVAVKKVVVE